MELKDKENYEIEERPPLLVIILSIAVFAAVIGLTLFFFITSS